MRSNRGSRTAQLVAAFAVLILGGGLTACSGGSQQDDSGATGLAHGSAEMRDAPNAATSDTTSSNGLNRAMVQTRSVIKTGHVAVTSKDPEGTRAEVVRLVFAFGGSIDSERTSNDAAGEIERSTLVLRVPVARFPSTMEALEELGKKRSSSSRSKDVTTKVIDVNERVETLQNSLDRLQDYQSRAENINALIRFEQQITERESELQSLKAQQAYLLDQTAMSTIMLHLSTPEKYVAPPDALENAGFLTGLKTGWNALVDFVVVALTVIGAALPFAIALALVGVPTWLLVRRLVRQRDTPPAQPDPPSATE